MRVHVAKGNDVGDPDVGDPNVSRPDSGWIQKEDSYPLLSFPRLDPLWEVGTRKFLSEPHPPFCPLPRDPINLQVLQAFVDCHEFANLNLVQALR